MLQKKRILLTMPVLLIEDVDFAAMHLRMSRGEFVKHALLKSLGEFRENQAKYTQAIRPGSWSLPQK